MRRGFIAAAAVAALALVLPAAAEARTFCAGISAADCDSVYPATGDGVQAALIAADGFVNFDGSPNTVRIGPGTYTQTGNKGYTVNSAVIVVGQGAATVLTASPNVGPNGHDGFISTGLPSTLQDLVVRITGPAVSGVSGASAPTFRIVR